MAVTEAARLPDHRLTPGSARNPAATSPDPVSKRRGGGGWRWLIRRPGWWPQRLSARPVAAATALALRRSG